MTDPLAAYDACERAFATVFVCCFCDVEELSVASLSADKERGKVVSSTPGGGILRLEWKKVVDS
jgi:hypothetical protein